MSKLIPADLDPAAFAAALTDQIKLIRENTDDPKDNAPILQWNALITHPLVERLWKELLGLLDDCPHNKRKNAFTFIGLILALATLNGMSDDCPCDNFDGGTIK